MSADDKKPPVGPPRPSLGAGRSGSAGSIGQELGGDLDFEPDALLDSLLSEAPPAATETKAAPQAPAPPETTPKQPLRPKEAPLAAPPHAPARPPPRLSLEKTRTPPAVNPAGLPPREPFLPANSPQPPNATARAVNRPPPPSLPRRTAPGIPGPANPVEGPPPTVPRPDLTPKAQGGHSRFEMPTMPDISGADGDALLEDDDDLATSFFQRDTINLEADPTDDWDTLAKDLTQGEAPLLESETQRISEIPEGDTPADEEHVLFGDSEPPPDEDIDALLASSLPPGAVGSVPPEDFEDETGLFDRPAAGPTMPAPALRARDSLAPDQSGHPSVPPRDDALDEDEESERPTAPPRGMGVPSPSRPPEPARATFTSQPDRVSFGSEPDRPSLGADLVRGDRLSDAVPDSVLATGEERSASSHLQERLFGGEWRRRAEWLEAEARAMQDPAARGRALLIASEHYAMLGDYASARRAAGELHAVAPTLAMGGRQLRWLAAKDHDWKAVTSILELETRAAPNEDARAHAANFAAEVHRVALGDVVNARRKFELASRVRALDPRPYVSKLAEQIGQAPAPPRLRWPEGPGLESLIQAAEELAALRSGRFENSASSSPVVHWEEARRALAIRDPQAAVAALKRLTGSDALGAAALWLIAALAAHTEESRPESIAALTALLNHDDAALARPALAARCLEQGEGGKLAAALFQEGELCETFEASDVLALEALTKVEGLNTTREADTEMLALLRFGSELATLAADRPLTTQLKSAAAMAAVNLGRAIAAIDPNGELKAASESSDPIDALLTQGESEEGAKAGPVLKLLKLDRQVTRADAQAVAQALRSWPGSDASKTTTSIAAPTLVAALVLESTGHADQARHLYEQVRQTLHSEEAPVRALLAEAEPNTAAELLETLAEHVSDPNQVALLYLEAALRRSGDPTLSRRALEHAATALPEVPLPYLYGEHQARLAGDADQLLGWLRRRRETSDDDMDRAFDLVREALLVAESDMRLSRELLAEASALRPADIALRELHERLGANSEVERGQWREHIAAEQEGTAAYALWAEAALEYERAQDFEGAARAAAQAQLANPESSFAGCSKERLSLLAGDFGPVVDKLIADSREEKDPERQRDIYQRLSDIDEQRGQHSSAVLWQTAILESNPDDLLALRHLEREYISSGRFDELCHIAAELSRCLDPVEAAAHAIWAAQHRLFTGQLAEAEPLVVRAASGDNPSLWALRALSAQAAANEDTEASLRADLALIERLESPLDLATLSLRAAEASARLGRLEAAKGLLQRALHEFPGHPVALTTLADVMEAMEAYEDAAEALESAATHSGVERYQLEYWFHAAVLWQDRVNNEERAVRALEEAVERDVMHDHAFLRLQDLYGSRHETQKLALLLDKRLNSSTDPDERVRIEVLRGQALVKVGEKSAALQALRAALDANPEHAGALSALSDLCYEEGDWEGAEQALIRLARHAPDVERQAQIYRRLGSLYDDQLPNPSRAELAYQEVLKRVPGDRDATEKLLTAYARMGNAERAIEIAGQLLASADTPEERRDAMLRMANLYESVAKEPRRAEELLTAARKEFGYDSHVLKATAHFHQSQGDERGLALLLDRTANEARRALGTGRFDAKFFEALGAIMELRGENSGALVTAATLEAIQGQNPTLYGVGPEAGLPSLNELLAPSALSAQLRALFTHAGDIFDAAFPVDLRGLRAALLPQERQEIAAHVQQLAGGFGLHSVEIYVSGALGPTCMPVCSAPPRILLGESLLDLADHAARDFLFLRALKLVQARMSVLPRTPPVDLWPVVAGFLSLFAANWEPQGAEAEKTAQAAQRLRAVFPPTPDPDLPALALEVIGAIGNRASQLGTLANQWGNRTALLAMGNPNIAFAAIAYASGRPEGPPVDQAQRLRWIVRSPEARDIAVFSVDPKYLEARSSFGR